MAGNLNSGRSDLITAVAEVTMHSKMLSKPFLNRILIVTSVGNSEVFSRPSIKKVSKYTGKVNNDVHYVFS